MAPTPHTKTFILLLAAACMSSAFTFNSAVVRPPVHINSPALSHRRQLPRTACRVVMTNTQQTKETQETASSYSFVQDDMRRVAMSLHSRDQAREGKQQAQTPFQQWQPARSDYLQFLVDSKHVYAAMESIVAATPTLASLKDTGLERVVPLEKDIAWFVEQGEEECAPSSRATEYTDFLETLASDNLEGFVCHFYNQYFAHTAGGRMIGAKMSKLLLDGRTLHFYQWEGDVKQLLESVRQNIDAMAASWTQPQKDACLEETQRSFQFGGSLLAPLRGPQ